MIAGALILVSFTPIFDPHPDALIFDL